MALTPNFRRPVWCTQPNSEWRQVPQVSDQVTDSVDAVKDVIEWWDLQVRFDAWCKKNKWHRGLEYISMVDGKIYLNVLTWGIVPLSDFDLTIPMGLKKLVNSLLWHDFLDELVFMDDDELQSMDDHEIIHPFYTEFFLEFTDLEEGIMRLTSNISYKISWEWVRVYLND